MRTTLSLWLTGIILLTVIAFLAVFQPITFGPRKDPSDTSLYLRPVGTKKFDAHVAPSPYTSFGRVGMYLYVPQHDLRLGLDLRGGMHVVLQIPNRAEFEYKLNKPLAGELEAGDKQKALAIALADPSAFGKDAEDGNKISANVDESRIQVIIQMAGASDAQDYIDAQNAKTKVDAVMAKVFATNPFTATNASTFYKQVNPEEQESVRKIMEKRLNPDGTKEVVAFIKGTNQVVVEIPGEKDPAHVEQLIGTTAKMEFRLIPQNINVMQDHTTNTVTITEQGKTISDKDAVDASYRVVDGKALKPTSDVTYDQSRQPAVSFEMASQENRERFGAVTGSNVGRQLAIVLDNKIITAPVIKDAIQGQGIISGGFQTMQEAKDLATLLNAGALPVPVKIVENRTVSATLGADSVALSMQAGLVGLLAVLIFMFAYYRLPGLMADVALTIYIFLMLGVMWVFHDVTLTLPGIAGIIISIGMAVDANVIIFERLKEELHAKKSIETAIDVAFSRAWTAILDSNIASLITGAVLYQLGSGAVKGFAVTLLIGVTVSLFTAVTVTRLLMKLMSRTKVGHNLAWYGI